MQLNTYFSLFALVPLALASKSLDDCKQCPHGSWGSTNQQRYVFYTCNAVEHEKKWKKMCFCSVVDGGQPTGRQCIAGMEMVNRLLKVNRG